MLRSLILAAVALAPFSATYAADLDGVVMPDTRVTDGTRMRLNGIGLRTYSIFGVHIYVAGLYLERQSDNPDSILHSSERKLLHIRFLRDVDAQDARKAWQDGFESNCRRPGCDLNPRDVQQFLSAVPPIHKGDETTLFFTSRGVGVTYNGRSMGDINDPHFAETMLATFIGPVPPTPQLKRELLGGAE
jgi:hypothetical protein